MSNEQLTEQRQVNAGIDTAEQYANSGTIVELDGRHLADTLHSYGLLRREIQRSRFNVPLARLAVQNEIPLYLS